MTRKLPDTITADLNSIFPRWPCYVIDRNIGTAYGGYFRGFKSHADMDTWLDKHGYHTITGGNIFAPEYSR